MKKRRIACSAVLNCKVVPPKDCAFQKSQNTGVLICTWCYLQIQIKKCTWCVMHACFLLQESSKCCSPPIINVVVRTAFECASRHMLKHYGSCFAKLQVCLEKTILPVFLLNSKSCTVCFQWTRARGLYMPIHLKVRIACFMSCSFSMLCQMRRE